MIRSIAFAAVCLLTSSCSTFHTADGYHWVGRWADDTGYFLDVRHSGGCYRLTRSGNPAQLEFLDLSDDERRFRYREDDAFIHTLTVVSRDVIHDEWLELPAKTIWRTNDMHRVLRR